MSLSPADLKQLQAAKNLLENPGLTAQLTSLLGTPIEYGLKKLPRKVNEKLGSVIEGALLKVARSATATLQENASGQPANRLHTLGAAVSGGRRRPRRRGDQHGVHEPFPGHGARSLRRPPPGAPLRQGCGSRRLRPAATARLSMPAHAVSLAPGEAAATRQVFSAVSLAAGPRAEPGWSRAPRRLRAPGRGCTTGGKRNGWCRRSGCRNSSGDSRCRSCWCRR